MVSKNLAEDPCLTAKLSLYGAVLPCLNPSIYSDTCLIFSFSFLSGLAANSFLYFHLNLLHKILRLTDSVMFLYTNYNQSNVGQSHDSNPPVFSADSVQCFVYTSVSSFYMCIPIYLQNYWPKLIQTAPFHLVKKPF